MVSTPLGPVMWYQAGGLEKAVNRLVTMSYTQKLLTLFPVNFKQGLAVSVAVPTLHPEKFSTTSDRFNTLQNDKTFKFLGCKNWNF